MEIPYRGVFGFPFAAFRIIFLYLTFAIVMLICLNLGLFGFILFGHLCVLCIWISVSFFMFGKFSTKISSNIVSIAFSLLLLEPLYNVNVRIRNVSWAITSSAFIFKFLFLSVLIGWFPLFYFLDHLCIFLCCLICCSFPLFFFISTIEFLIILIFSSSLLKYSVFRSLLFPNSVNFFFGLFFLFLGPHPWRMEFPRLGV